MSTSYKVVTVEWDECNNVHIKCYDNGKLYYHAINNDFSFETTTDRSGNSAVYEAALSEDQIKERTELIFS